jgi:hypothetical protein
VTLARTQLLQLLAKTEYYFRAAAVLDSQAPLTDWQYNIKFTTSGLTSPDKPNAPRLIEANATPRRGGYFAGNEIYYVRDPNTNVKSADTEAMVPQLTGGKLTIAWDNTMPREKDWGGEKHLSGWRLFHREKSLTNIPKPWQQAMKEDYGSNKDDTIFTVGGLKANTKYEFRTRAMNTKAKCYEPSFTDSERMKVQLTPGGAWTKEHDDPQVYISDVLEVDTGAKSTPGSIQFECKEDELDDECLTSLIEPIDALGTGGSVVLSIPYPFDTGGSTLLKPDIVLTAGNTHNPTQKKEFVFEERLSDKTRDLTAELGGSHTWSFVLYGLLEETPYLFRICPRNSKGAGVCSANVKATTSSATLPTEPTQMYSKSFKSCSQLSENVQGSPWRRFFECIGDATIMEQNECQVKGYAWSPMNHVCSANQAKLFPAALENWDPYKTAPTGTDAASDGSVTFSWPDARTKCQNLGARLCSEMELKQGVIRDNDHGARFDGTCLWSSTPNKAIKYASGEQQAIGLWTAKTEIFTCTSGDPSHNTEAKCLIPTVNEWQIDRCSDPMFSAEGSCRAATLYTWSNKYVWEAGRSACVDYAVPSTDQSALTDQASCESDDHKHCVSNSDGSIQVTLWDQTMCELDRVNAWIVESCREGTANGTNIERTELNTETLCHAAKKYKWEAVHSTGITTKTTDDLPKRIRSSKYVADCKRRSAEDK